MESEEFRTWNLPKMNDAVQTNTALDRWKNLSIEVREILSLTSKKALERDY